MKKGFTLIELLATVVILSILFLFITPKITTLINQAEENNKAIIEEKVIDAGRAYITEYNKSFLDNFKTVGTIAYITSNELLSAGLIDEGEIDNLDSPVSVKVELLDNDVLEYTIYYGS